MPGVAGGVAGVCLGGMGRLGASTPATRKGR